MTPKPFRLKNGKYALKDFAVAVNVTHYIEVRARDKQDALRRAGQIASDRYGPGHNTTPVEATELT